MRKNTLRSGKNLAVLLVMLFIWGCAGISPKSNIHVSRYQQLKGDSDFASSNHSRIFVQSQVTIGHQHSEGLTSLLDSMLHTDLKKMNYPIAGSREEADTVLSCSVRGRILPSKMLLHSCFFGVFDGFQPGKKMRTEMCYPLGNNQKLLRRIISMRITTFLNKILRIVSVLAKGICFEDNDIVLIVLDVAPRHRIPRCSQCGKKVRGVHSSRVRRRRETSAPSGA